MSRRDVNPLFQKIRAFLLGREHTVAVRFQDELSTRSPCPPCLPYGSSHCLSKNYYFNRNPRGIVVPPKSIWNSKHEFTLSPTLTTISENIRKDKKKGRTCSGKDDQGNDIC